MKTTSKSYEKIWVEKWKNAGVVLENIKKLNLQSYDYKKNRMIVDELLQLACRHITVKRHSGLVDQQRFFMTLRKGKGKFRNEPTI